MIAALFREIAALVILLAAFAAALGYLISLVRRAVRFQDRIEHLSSQTLDAVTPGNGGITATLADIADDLRRLDQKLDALIPKEKP